MNDEIDEKIDSILWPHPFSGEAHRPNVVAVSNGYPPEGKTFALTYHTLKTAIKAIIDEAVREALSNSDGPDSAAVNDANPR